MKKFLALILAVAMLCTLCACGSSGWKDGTDTPEKTPEESKPAADTVKFGSAVYATTPSATSATADQNGQGKVDFTVAAVIMDGDKIVSCELDTLQINVAYTTDGKAIANDGFKTKYELGDNYKMKNYETGYESTWAQQADAFEGVVAGKTLAEVKAMLVEEGKGNEEVAKAGCTIAITDFINVIEKAVANAKTDVAGDVTLKVTTFTEQTCTDATTDKDGSNKVSTTFFAAAVKDGKVVSADSDCIEVSFGFDMAGQTKFDAAKAIVSKREQGDNYKMKNYETGYESTWAQQADAFDAQCEGKTSSEIAGLQADEGKGAEAVQKAGCTITVTGLVGAASKI